MDDDVRRDIERHEAAIASLWKDKAALRDIDQLSKDFEKMVDEVSSLRRTIIGFAFTVAISAVGIAAAVLTAGANP